MKRTFHNDHHFDERNIFRTVKAAISVRQAAERYGLTIYRNGMSRCLFHDDQHPSMKLYDDHYYCFACHAHGDVIDLTAALFNLTAYEAAQRLAYDFGLSLDEPPPPKVAAKMKADRDALLLRKQELRCVSILIKYLWLLRDWKERYAPKVPSEVPDERFVQACHWLGYVDYLIDTILWGCPDEIASTVRELTASGAIDKLQRHLENAGEEDGRHERDLGIAV